MVEHSAKKSGEGGNFAKLRILIMNCGGQREEAQRFLKGESKRYLGLPRSLRGNIAELCSNIYGKIIYFSWW